MKIKLQMILSMLLFGSIGVFVKHISLPSAVIVQWRTIIATVFLILLFCAKKQKPDWRAIKENACPLLLSGTVLGGNWAFLFLAFQYTSVGLSTILYYLAPVIVFFAAPLLFKEKITLLQLLGISAAIAGSVLVNAMSVTTGAFSIAMVYALIAAFLYAMVMICNRFMRNISGLDSTLVQMFLAAIVMSIYCFATTGQLLTIGSAKDMLFVGILGVVHTGAIFPLYFYAIQKLSPQNTAIFSYLDPASALVFSFIFLQETLAWYQLVGAILIFGGVLFAQMQQTHSQSTSNCETT